MSDRYHVVLVVFDTLRKDALGCYGLTPPWGEDFPAIATPNLDAFAAESVRYTRAYPESLPTLPARRALYTGQRTYPFHNGDFKLKGDFIPAPGWGPIPEEQHTLAEILGAAGFRTGLVSDLYHQFKPSKNFWRGFDEWDFIRGQETDPARSGPAPTEEEIAHWIPEELRELRRRDPAGSGRRAKDGADWFSSRILANMRDRVAEDQWFNAQVMTTAARWLEQNLDVRRTGERMFLTVESFDPHEPWFVPEHYRRRYDPSEAREQVISPYAEVPDLPAALLRRTRANYAGLVTMADRWFGHLMAALSAQGWLQDTVVVVASDHGHSLAERRHYIGKRGYPSEPEVLEVPLLIRHPAGLGAGRTVDDWVQHHDLAATILDAAQVPAPDPIDGRSCWLSTFGDARPARDHVVVGWGSAFTVITDDWWFTSKVNGKGAFLHALRQGNDGSAADPWSVNLAEKEPAVVADLFERGVAAAAGGFPRFLLDAAESTEDAPGCSPLAASPLAR